MTATLELAKALPAEAANTLLPAALRKSTAHAGEYLSFRIGDEEYALGILNVQEIRSYEAPTRMAGAPACIKGVVNLRGVIVPIVDLRSVLGIGEPRDDGFTVVIVLNVLQRVIGVVVDSVSDVVALRPEQIRSAPEMNGASSHSFINGLATLGDGNSGSRERMLILADIEQLLGSASIGLIDGEPALH
ncbi:chemotaxis protein CheW [Pelomonas saccharophila]|nr:chemotaxis protein CheW [Roseateles saccharophilus]